MKYSNPRTHAVIENWPHGARRTTATFNVETHPSLGQRATRTTVDPKRGGTSKPKLGVYASAVRIVDGEDGRTYIASFSRPYRSISVMQGNMQYQAEYIGLTGRSDEAELLALFA